MHYFKEDGIWSLPKIAMAAPTFHDAVRPRSSSPAGSYQTQRLAALATLLVVAALALALTFGESSEESVCCRLLTNPRLNTALAGWLRNKLDQG